MEVQQQPIEQLFDISLKKSEEIKIIPFPMFTLDIDHELNENLYNEVVTGNEILEKPTIILEPIPDIPVDPVEPTDVNSYLKNFLVLFSGWLSNYFNSLLEK